MVSHSKNRKAAWSLALLAPFVAELAFGSTPPHLAYLILVWLPVYGAGVVLIRELARRYGLGWLGIILLGVCYELLEDGLGLQALTSPHLYHAAEWGPRLLGLNLTYWQANLTYHIIFSVIIPIYLTERLFAKHGSRPYLTKVGTWVAGVVTLLGVGLLRISVPPSQDPGYQTPLAYMVFYLLVIIGVAVLAFRSRHKRTVSVSALAPPQPRYLVLGAFVAAILVLLPFIGYGGNQAFVFGRNPGALVPMGIALITIVGAGWYVARWARSRTWSLAHSDSLLVGALAGHFVYGLAVITGSVVDRIGLVIINLLLGLVVYRAVTLPGRHGTEPGRSR